MILTVASFTCTLPPDGYLNYSRRSSDLLADAYHVAPTPISRLEESGEHARMTF